MSMGTGTGMCLACIRTRVRARGREKARIGLGEGGDGGGCGEREGAARGRSVEGRAWPIRVRSTHPLTTRAATSSKGSAKRTLMMGVATLLAALMISLMRGTPAVMFMLATPAKWKVLSVICVPGSPMDCAPTAPTWSGLRSGLGLGLGLGFGLA